ncbi:MAG: 30S ribosomal protein S15 [Thermoplasmata archaeon]
MARMHARKRGKSGSTRPNVTEKPEWIIMDEDEIVQRIVTLAKQGKNSGEIGIALRDQFGVPSVKLVTEKSISQIMKENEVYPDLPEDLLFLMEKAVNLYEHIDENNKDRSNRRGLQQIEAKIRRLVKYYKRKEVLPENWRYNRDLAEMLTQ